ncbi:MAG TPA: polysaccharide deacetylase family protein [Candidatus Angelobacter sp.]|nr:polysaccharide deacetylase family protein [Candidatus Angelobacter sp.]
MKKFRCHYFFLVMVLTVFIFGMPCPSSAQQKVPILVYHWIGKYEGIGEKELYVTPENFEKQMLFLKKQGYTLLTFEDWNKVNQVKKPIFITFDDGYKQTKSVWSVFKKLKSDQFQPKATLFVISDFLDRSNRLNKEDLKLMADSGYFSVQSHTATHPDLTKSKDLDYQLGQSKMKIEKVTGKPVIALAYPYGLYNDKVVIATKNYYKFGLTTLPKLYVKQGKPNENYLLPRIYVYYSTTLDQFSQSLQ